MASRKSTQRPEVVPPSSQGSDGTDESIPSSEPAAVGGDASMPDVRNAEVEKKVDQPKDSNVASADRSTPANTNQPNNAHGSNTHVTTAVKEHERTPQEEDPESYAILRPVLNALEKVRDSRMPPANGSVKANQHMTFLKIKL
ncbi:hypothetical protein K491DRAFT_773590, partial [Lophiostoma macrostomum CBS 122681]